MESYKEYLKIYLIILLFLKHKSLKYIYKAYV